MTSRERTGAPLVICLGEARAASGEIPELPGRASDSISSPLRKAFLDSLEQFLEQFLVWFAMRIRVVTALLLLLCVACAARRDRGIRSLDSSAKRRSKRLPT